MPTLRLTLKNPHPAQRRILSRATRFNVVCCGRRFGKTIFGEHRIIRPALAGYPTGWFAPTYKILADAWRDVIRDLKPVIAKPNETAKRIELIGGGSIEFWSLEDEDAGRSRKYKHVIIDEAAKVKRLESAWNASIRPTLTDMKGSADFLSTPKGRVFFWKLYTRGQDEARPAWSSFRSPTSENPYIDPQEIEDARGDLPERLFEQEYLAEFLDNAGGVFRGVREAIDAGRTANEPAAAPGRTGYVLGVDLAKVEDFTVLTVVDSGLKQVYHERFNKISWELQIARITDLAQRYRADVVVDSTGVGDPIFERLRNAGLQVMPYGFTNVSKEALINNLAMKLEQGAVRLMDLDCQTNELLAYEYELTPSRNVRMNAPAGMHDDCVISLALAAWGRGQVYSGGFF